MDGAELRALQAPLKQRYRDDPATAVTPLSSRGAGEGDDVAFTVQTWAGPARAGLHPATGGDGSDACSGDLLLDALLACAGVTLRSVATAMGLGVRAVSGEAASTFDARGTLGVDREAPVGLTAVRLTFTVDADADDDQLARLGQLTERYCVVAQSLRATTEITVRRA